MDRCRRARVLFQRVWRASPSFWITLQQPIRTSTATAATVTTTTLNATTGTPTATTGTSTGSSRRTFALFLPSNTLPWTRPRLQQVRLVSLQQQLQRRRLPLPGSRILSLTLQNRTITGTSDTAKNYFSSHSYGTNGVFWENHNTKRPKVRMVSSFSNTFSTNHRSPPLNDDDATPNGGEIENHVPTTSSGSSVSSASWIPPNVADTSESEDDAADAPPINTSNGTDPGGGADTTANYYELAIRRALQLSPDEEWDKQVLVVAASLPLRKDAEKNHFDSEEPVESYDTTIDYHLSHRQDKNNTDPTNLTLNLSWNDRQWKIQSTARLLNSPVGSWSVEDWFALEDLFVHFWARQDCMRSVVAQLTLFERCLLEKNRIFQVEPCSSSISSSRGEPNILTSEILETTNGVKDGVISLHSSESLEMHINTWLNLHLLNHIVDSWRFVYAAEPLPLRNCQLAPLDVLDKVLHVFHKQLGCEVSAKTFYFIAEAEMAYPHKDRTPEILDKLLATTIGLYNEGMELCLPKNLFWNMALTAWMKAERGSDSVDAVTRLLQTMDDLQISRSKRTYLTAIRAHAQQCSEKAALDAEGLLQRMYSEYVSGAYKVQPDVYAFAAVVDAWAKSKSPLAGPRAEQIYQQMLELRKQDQLYGYKNEDTTLINCAIMCWGNVGTVEAVAKGEAFWRSTGVIPTSVTFTTLINLYSDLGQVADAERLWQELDITEDENGHVLRRENALYLSMLSMYAKSKIPNRVERASSIIQKINDSGEIAPSNAVYNGTWLCMSYAY